MFLRGNSMTMILFLALIGQSCPGGQCSVAQPAYSLPRYFYAPAPAPQLWQVTDRYGYTMRSTSPAYLRTWIAHRNGLVLTAPVGGR